MSDDVDAALAGLIRSRARAEGVAWLDQAIGDAAAGRGDLRVVFPAVARQLGRGGLDEPGATLTTAAGDPVSLAAWRIDDAGRVRLLLAAARRDPGGALGLARELYLAGDARERTGALRALPFLPGAAGDAAALPALLDAMRVTQGEIFEAAILDNPYASRHLPQHEWRKAVLKAIFLGHSILRIGRLAERADADLAQSLVAFAEEREAATRSVPPELWPIAALFPPPGLAAKLLGYLEHPNPDHRAAAAAGLALLARNDARLRPFLADRAGREQDGVVQDALRAALG
jgi:hypothetical protein